MVIQAQNGYGFRSGGKMYIGCKYNKNVRISVTIKSKYHLKLFLKSAIPN